MPRLILLESKLAKPISIVVLHVPRIERRLFRQ